MRNVHTSAAALFLAVAGLSATASAQQSPFGQNGPFVNFGDNSPAPIDARYTPSAFLTNDPASIANADATLASAQAQGKPLAVKVIEPLTNPAALALFNKYAVQFVFTDFEDAARVGRTRAVADQVLHSTKSKNAYVGNFNFYPNASSDTTQPGSLSGSQAQSFQFANNSLDYSDSRGRLGTTYGKQMANPALYPGSPDYRNPAQGNSGAPNIRSALFTLPIQRETFATNGLLGRSVPSGSSFQAYNTPFSNGGYKNGARNIPYVTRFNNWGNPALGGGPTGNGFVQNAADPANGQLLSRGDFEAMVLHYRLRGADTFHLFNEADGSVVGYSKTQEAQDAANGWAALGTAGGSALNGIFSRHNYGFANLTNLIGDKGGDSGDTSPRSTEVAGAVWSGVFDKSGTSRHLAILISNLSPVRKTIDLPNKVGGFMTARADGVRIDDFFLDPGQHKLLTFTFSSATSRWKMDSFINPNGNAIVFTDNNRNGVGIPEPTGLSLLGLGAVGLLARRRRHA
jgi:hypothetical protein